MKDLKIKRLMDLEASLNEKLVIYKTITDLYIKKAEELEDKKIQLIDTSKRDSVEKQMMAFMQSDENLKTLFLSTETARRRKDELLKEIDVLKTLIDVNKTILLNVENTKDEK